MRSSDSLLLTSVVCVCCVFLCYADMSETGKLYTLSGYLHLKRTKTKALTQTKQRIEKPLENQRIRVLTLRKQGVHMASLQFENMLQEIDEIDDHFAFMCFEFPADKRGTV